MDDRLWVMMAGHQICKAFARKYALGLKIRELLSPKTCFSFYKPVKISHRTPEIGDRIIKTCCPIYEFGGQTRAVRWPKNHVANPENWQEIRWPNLSIRWPNFNLQTSIFLLFCGFQLHEPQWITLKNTWKMPTKLVMTECHHQQNNLIV